MPSVVVFHSLPPQGAAQGIGFETARALASVGAKVTAADRSQAQAEEAVAELRKALGPDLGPTADLAPLELDLASLANVRKNAAAFMRRVPKLNVLINNAGASRRTEEAPPLLLRSVSRRRFLESLAPLRPLNRRDGDAVGHH